MKKSLLSLVLALLVLPIGSFAPLAAQATSFSTNTAIRGTSMDTVYWFATDGKRYVFPNALTFYSWFPSFDNVRTISDSELYLIPIGGNVTYRPGAKLVKVTTDPKTYVVSRGGVLRHVTSEYLASQLYGYDWRSKVNDIPDVYFTNYTVGSPIYNVSDYNVSNEYSGVSTPSDSLRGMTGSYNTNYTNFSSGSSSLSADRTSVNNGDSVTLTATASNLNTTASYIRMELYRESNNLLLDTCYDSATCTFSQRATNDGSGAVRFYVIVKNDANEQIPTAYSPRITVNGGSSTGSATLSATLNKTSIVSGEEVTVNAYASNVSEPANNLRMELYTNWTVQRLATCSDSLSCTFRERAYNYSDIGGFDVFYVKLMTDDGRELARFNLPQFTFNGSSASQNDGVNYINGLVLNTDRTSINPGNVVRLTANAFNSGTWSYSGNRLEITDVRTGSIVRTCYDVSTCTVDAYPQAQSSGNLTAQYQTKIYDRTGGLAMSQYSQVIYLSGYNGSSNDFSSLNGSAYITLAPAENLRVNRIVYLTSTFTGMNNLALADAQIQIFTELSSTPVATCVSAYTCSVSFPTGTSPINTRMYARISDRNNANRWLETNHASLVTTW